MARLNICLPFVMLALFITIAVFNQFTSAAEEETNKSPSKQADLKVRDSAPNFEGIADKLADGSSDDSTTNSSDDNKLWKSDDRQGKKILVVYFYPADMTPGCTKQACSYRDAITKLDREDVEVVGISGDTAENHSYFRQVHKLNFTLLADPKGTIAEKFGVKYRLGNKSIERKIGGKSVILTRGVTASRWTFVIDKDWRIAHKDTSVNPSKDSAQVFKVIAGLK